MRRAWLAGLFAVTVFAAPACKDRDDAKGGADKGADALAQLQLAGGDDAAVVLTLNPSAWSSMRGVLAHVSTEGEMAWLAPIVSAESARSFVEQLVGKAAAPAFAAPGVRLSCGIGATSGANITREARLLAAVTAGQPVGPALGEARGRCVFDGVSLEAVGALFEHLGWVTVSTDVPGARAWQSGDGIFVAARQEAGAVVAAGTASPERDAGAPEDVDAAVAELLKPGAAPPETPGLLALAEPGSLGGVLIRTDAARRLGLWVGLHQLVAFYYAIPESERLRATATGVRVAAAVDHIVPGLPPDVEDAAVVLGAEGDRLVLTTVQSLTDHGAAVIDAALGEGARTRALKAAPPGVEIGVRFDAAAASALLGAAGLDPTPEVSPETMVSAGIWGYAGLIAHTWSLAAGVTGGDDGLGDVLEKSTFAPGDIARWSVDLSKARAFFDLGFVRPASLGVKRIDGIARRSGRAMVFRAIASFGQSSAPALTAPSFEGITWATPAPTAADRCLLQANQAFRDLLRAYGRERTTTADLAARVLTIAEGKGCLGGSVPHERRLTEMLWASKMLVADLARGRWDRSTVAVSLAGACDQEVIPAACAMMRANAAGPSVPIVSLPAGCEGYPRGTVVRVAAGDDGPAVWVANDAVADPASAVAALKKAGDGRPAPAVLLVDPKLTLGELSPLLDALTAGEVVVSAGLRAGGSPVATRIRWEPDAAPADDLVSLPPTTPWKAVIERVGGECAVRMALGSATRPEADPAEGPEAPGDPPEALAPLAVALGEVSVQGGCPRDAVRAVIRRHVGAFRACVEGGRPGAIRARFKIEGDGRSTGVKALDETAGKADLSTCVSKQIARIRFPPPRGGGVCIVRATLDVTRP